MISQRRDPSLLKTKQNAKTPKLLLKNLCLTCEIGEDREPVRCGGGGHVGGVKQGRDVQLSLSQLKDKPTVPEQLKLSLSLWLYVPLYLPTYLPLFLPTYLPTYLPIYLPTYLHTYLPTYLSTYLHPESCLSLYVTWDSEIVMSKHLCS